MSSSVSVLAPNGRRQTVKCTANTTILQIIEEVCRKQGFNPEDYDIKHHNKVMDTTLSFRFSGLPNNAQLELSTATKARVDSEIILAVNLENGGRLMGNFQPDDTLWKILLQLCPNDFKPDDNPVVIYMRNEVYGSALHTATLRSLGLRGGRAMIRLLHRDPDELRTQANVSAALPSKPTEEKPYHRTLKTEDKSSNSNDAKPVQKSKELDILKLAREKRKLETSPVLNLDRSNGYTLAGTKKETKVESMECDEEKLTEKATKIVPPKEIEEEFVFLGARNAMLFSLESARSVPSEDLPDDFFELTIDDAKRILHDIKRSREAMDNGMLMTSALRNLEESKKQLRQLQRYKKSVIRIQFSDRSVLQGTFKPTESIADVITFVREYLENKTYNLYLYTTPPKNILCEKDSLVEVGCVPGALLHLGSDSCEATDLQLRPELRDKFTTNSMASLAASKMRKDGTRPESAIFKDEDESMEICSDPNVPGPSTHLTSCERKFVSTPAEKVPKWFKTSK